MTSKQCTVAGAAFLLILISFLQPVCYAQTRRGSETILAKVNGTAITVHDLDCEIAQLRAEMDLRNQPITNEQVNRLRHELIENLIERELLYQHARENKISIRSRWVNAALADFKSELGGAAALRTYLAASGQTHSQLKATLEKGLAVRRLLRREAIRTVRVREAEMQAFYRRHPEFFERGEQIRVRHILIAVNDWNNEGQRTKAWKKINALKMRIEKGENFAVLALEYSDGPSRIQAGDLGYLTRSQLIKPFADAAFALPTGAVSDIVRTRFGYHLIKVLDRRPPAKISYKDSREKIERTLRRNKENAAVVKYVALLKSQAQIQRFGSGR
jgi:peptidyl-prolyl cis-trans isomerase C